MILYEPSIFGGPNIHDLDLSVSLLVPPSTIVAAMTNNVVKMGIISWKINPIFTIKETL